jgi:hypothetical protein
MERNGAEFLPGYHQLSESVAFIPLILKIHLTVNNAPWYINLPSGGNPTAHGYDYEEPVAALNA